MLAMGLAIAFGGLAFRRGEEVIGGGRAARPARAAPGRDRLAVPLAAGRAARPQRARVRGDHRPLGRRSCAARRRTSWATAWSPPTTRPSRGRAPLRRRADPLEPRGPQPQTISSVATIGCERPGHRRLAQQPAVEPVGQARHGLHADAVRVGRVHDPCRHPARDQRGASGRPGSARPAAWPPPGARRRRGSPRGSSSDARREAGRHRAPRAAGESTETSTSPVSSRRGSSGRPRGSARWRPSTIAARPSAPPASRCRSEPRVPADDRRGRLPLRVDLEAHAAGGPRSSTTVWTTRPPVGHAGPARPPCARCGRLPGAPPRHVRAASRGARGAARWQGPPRSVRPRRRARRGAARPWRHHEGAPLAVGPAVATQEIPAVDLEGGQPAAHAGRHLDGRPALRPAGCGGSAGRRLRSHAWRESSGGVGRRGGRDPAGRS